MVARADGISASRRRQDTLLSVDAYLTNSCKKIGDSMGLNMDRRVPIFIEPEELDVDHFLCTHSHYDHADPETIGRLRKQRRSETFVGPGLACESFLRCGVEKAKIQQVYPGAKTQVSDFTVHGTFAMPTDDSDLNHMGYRARRGKRPAHLHFGRYRLPRPAGTRPEA